MEPVLLRKDRVLLVDDDPFIAKSMVKRLSRDEGFDVSLAHDGETAWELFKKEKFDICLLDVVMPKLNGFELSKRIRKIDQQIPILFVTSKVHQEDRINGLTIGGDDYIVKPFSMAELILRINIFLKRTRPQHLLGQAIYKIRDYTLNLEDLTLTRDGIIEYLTPKEAQLLLFLIKNKNQFTSREEILLEVWGKDDYFLGRSLDVFITKLRKRFLGDNHILIDVRRNMGYSLQVVDGIQ
jgi:two-component system response regulator VicR